jgi:outer membrane receptor protein involved in Fe transport
MGLIRLNADFPNLQINDQARKSKENTIMQGRASIVLGFVIFISSLQNLVAATSGGGNISGFVKDAQTGEGLPGANVLVVGTSIGASTDQNGRFLILNIPSGSYTLRSTYIGYRTKETHLQIEPDSTVKIDFSLEVVAIQGGEVVVTGQAASQNAAINQQLASNQIVNVVSAAKIQELPDQNAAESVGRLPGISVLRNGGEGTEIVIRGLAPKYNLISIDGIQVSSSNPDDRSTDLSGISSNMLDGIKVYKTVTPDMDANVIGGTVDFDLREAKAGQSDIPDFSGLGQGGYKSLPDAYNKYNNYKYVASAGERFLDDRLGVLAQIDIERENLTSNELGASYNHLGNSTTQYVTTGLTLSDIPRDIERRNAALVVDYKLPEGSIKLSNFLNSGLSESESRQELFDIVDNDHDYVLGNQGGTGTGVINGIEFQNSFSGFQVDAKASSAYSDSRDPHDWSIEFLQTAAGLNQFNNQANVNPQDVPKAANDNFSNTILYLLSSNSYFSKARALTGSLDLKTDINFSDVVNAEIKLGGMYRYQTRYYVEDVYDGGGLQFGGSGVVNNLIINHFNLPANTEYQIPISYFIDPGFSYGTFLGGSYQMVEPLSYGILSQMADLLKDSAQYIARNSGLQAYGHDNFLSTTNNYSGYENQSAVYVMSVVHVGSDITLIPGVRYQDLRTTYTGARGVESRLSFNAYNFYDTTVAQDHGYYLPDVSLRYKPLSWLDVRLSYTNTIAYPDYNAIIPRIDVGVASISWNNYRLAPSRSTNYDAGVSFYDNSIGLFTVGGFWKKISDLIYPWTFYSSGANALQYYPPGLTGSSIPSGTYQVNTYVNDSLTINDYGLELDWETHFWYLPDPLSGLVLGVNYSHIFSKAQYPYQLTESNGRTISYIDTSFTDRLLYQPDNIFNLSMGFDYRAFSVRVSYLYQDNIFTGPNFWPQLRSYTAAYGRWDLEFNQGLPWFGLQLYGDLYNINKANDVSIIQGGNVPESEQSYGMTGDLGLRFNF